MRSDVWCAWRAGFTRTVFALGLILVCAPAALAVDLDALRQQGEQGNADTQELLGLHYHSGFGGPKDEAQALIWFRKAADQGRPLAQYSLGEMYEKGQGVPADTDKAVEWYRKAAEQGYARARGAIRKLYIEGKFVPANDSQAGSWWQALAAQAEAESRDFSQSRAAADAGNADAQVKVGILYLTGVGTRKDREKAAIWFGRAAEQGQAEGECILAALNAANTAWHVASQNAHAIETCRKAADQGYADAQVILAVHYAMGRGVPKDPAEAEVLWRKAAEQGRADAQAHVAGQIKDQAQAAQWYLKAAEQGDGSAAMLLNLSATGAKMSGESVQIPDTIHGMSLSDFAQEHSADRERDFLPNLWASPLIATETGHTPLWRTGPILATVVVAAVMLLASFVATWAWGWRAVIPAFAAGPALIIVMAVAGYLSHKSPIPEMVQGMEAGTILWLLAAAPVVGLAFAVRAITRKKRLA